MIGKDTIHSQWDIFRICLEVNTYLMSVIFNLFHFMACTN